MSLANKATGVRASNDAHRPGYETAAAKIMEFITTASLKPGDRLPTERALSEQLGVSRTVVREAVKVLTTTGVVRTHQGSGLYVNSVPRPFANAAIDLSMSVEPDDVKSLYEFRIMLEMQSACLAAERITPKELRQLQEFVLRNQQAAETNQQEQFHETDEGFHRGIANATRNPFLASAVTTAYSLQDWVATMVVGGTPGSILVAASQHADILAAIQDGQPELASTRMRTHIETTIANYHLEVRKRLLGETPIES